MAVIETSLSEEIKEQIIEMIFAEVFQWRKASCGLIVWRSGWVKAKGEKERVYVWERERERERERDSSMIVVFQSEKEAVKGERWRMQWHAPVVSGM